MVFNDVERILNRIRINRPKLDKLMETTSKNSAYKSEWYKVLKDYDYEDISNSLDDWLKQETHDGFIPSAYELVRECYTIAEKNKPINFKCSCRYCGKFMTYRALDKHEKRCRDINYICQSYKKYFGQDLDKNKLMNLDDKTFDDSYYRFLIKLLQIIEKESSEYRMIENILETKKGNKEKYAISEI